MLCIFFSKLSMVYNCTGCETFTLQPLGILKTFENKKNVKFCIPTGPAVNTNCEQCNHRHHVRISYFYNFF